MNTFDHVSLFLANALREAWEEIRVNPFNIRFLGPLPSRELYVFSRIIFPVVGLVKRNWRFQPNREVERIVEIPLQDFLLKTLWIQSSTDLVLLVSYRNPVD